MESIYVPIMSGNGEILIFRYIRIKEKGLWKFIGLLFYQEAAMISKGLI